MTKTRYRTYCGTRVHRWRTYPNRWGNGAVHLRVYVRDAKEWRFMCPLDFTHGEEITDRDVVAPVTCKRCLTSVLVPPDWRPTYTPAGHMSEHEE